MDKKMKLFLAVCIVVLLSIALVTIALANQHQPGCDYVIGVGGCDIRNIYVPLMLR